MNNNSLFKIICMYSIITGAAIGVLPLIPALTGAAFTLVMLFSAPLVLFYLYRLKRINGLETDQCLSIGAAAGFFSFLGFALVYFPLAVFLYLIFKIDAFLWIKVLLENIGFIIPMIVLTALLSGLINMFSAFMTVYFYEYLKPKTGEGIKNNGRI